MPCTPIGAGGAYVNFMMDEGEDRIRATYRGNYDRLAAIKARYDPDNFFRVNQNIRPTAAPRPGHLAFGDRLRNPQFPEAPGRNRRGYALQGRIRVEDFPPIRTKKRQRPSAYRPCSRA